MPAMGRENNLNPALRQNSALRLLQLSDPHLLADPGGLCRGRPALACLRHGLTQALIQLGGSPLDGLLISGDLCQDESWGGYVHLRELLQDCLPAPLPLALLPGNHDHAGLLRAALGRRAWLAPAAIRFGAWTLLLLSSHRPGSLAGWLEPPQMAWLQRQLAEGAGPVLLAVHHPPLPIGDPSLDGMALQQPERLLQCLSTSPRVRGVVFGHIHQHWHGHWQGLAGGAALPFWGCPSTLINRQSVQPCPLGRPDWPGARLLELGSDGALSSRLLRWPAFETA